MILAFPTQLTAVVAGILLGCTACTGKVATQDDGSFPPQIGTPRPIQSDDAYEQLVAQIIAHLEDGIQVLSSVDDVASSRHAAGMFLEASDRVVEIRRAMLEANPADAVPPSIILTYGPRYFFARFETKRQLDRIKALDDAIHQPLMSVLNRIDEQIKQVEKEFEEAKDRETIGG